MSKRSEVVPGYIRSQIHSEVHISQAETAKLSARARASAVAGLYRKSGHRGYLGEAVSQLEHAAQCADLAESEGHAADVVCAAFLHDVGHLSLNRMALNRTDLNRTDLNRTGLDRSEEQRSGGGIDPQTELFGPVVARGHELIGADYLREMGFGERVVGLVARHVAAKRFLTFKEAGYHGRLSEPSRLSLSRQGGPMSAAEAETFQDDPLFSLALELRTWDEAAKVVGRSTRSLERYQRLMAEHLESESQDR